MKFDRLRLAGFKSFVEPAELEIRDGLTGVVGPNGCGKSNLLEALRWVMGETSARSLRASGMDEVIFAGTARRPRRDLAEVRLTLDNRARTAPAGFNTDERIEIMRTIRRGEGSAWRLNGRDVRHKDVQLLFADAATGAHSPALVSQGRVAAIIHARPVERRELLENAAGISGLNARRREAEARLRAADANLLRLDDVLAASIAQANGLRRQAQAAARYRQLSAEIRTLEAQLARLRWVADVAAAQAAEQALRVATAALDEETRRAAAAAARQAEAAAGLPRLRDAHGRQAAIVQDLATTRATLEARRQALVRQLADLAHGREQLRADIARERSRQQDSQTTQARLQAELAAQQALATDMATILPGLLAAGATAEQALTMADRQLAAAVDAHAVLVADARAARARADAAHARVQRLASERQRLTADLARLAAGDSSADGLTAAEQALTDADRQATAAGQAVTAAEQALVAARQAGAAVEQAAAAARGEVAALSAEAEALARVRTSVDQPGERVELVADAGYEAAVAAAVGEDLAAGLGPRPGRHWLQVAAEHDPPLPAGVAPLAAHVQAPAELARRLAQVGVVTAAPTTADIARLAPGQRLVNGDGWLWRWDGFVAPPGAQGATVAAALAADNRHRRIVAALAEPRARLQAADAELTTQRAAIARWQQAERDARASRTEAERQRERLAGRLQGLRKADADLQARKSAIAASLARLAAEAESAGAEAEQAAAAVAGLPDTTAAAQAIGAARTAAGQARAQLAESRAEAAGAERSLAEARARGQRLTQEIADWQARDAEIATALAGLQTRAEAIDSEHAQLLGAPEALDTRLHALAAEADAAEQARGDAAGAVAAAELELADLDRATRAAEAAVADAREARATHAAREEQTRAALRATVAWARETFGADPAHLSIGDSADTDEPDLAAVDRQLAALRDKRERIGIVNLRADIELAEVEAQLTALQAERAELEAAIHRLRGSIGTLNREGRARLREAFARVDGHFRALFATLFEGGSAELALVDSDDELEAGLDVKAQPPGKRLQSLALLSGGEQALTACALIFALFLANPAPVSVLDEVDAPLDDANVARFTRLLQHMATTTDTRFLVVTHNPVTMAAMHRLYGVTMGEPGVSQLVSVALRDAEALAAS